MKIGIKYFFLLGIGFFQYGQDHAQQLGNDSMAVLLKSAKEDSNKVLLLNAMAYSKRVTNPDEATALGTEALQLSEKINFPIGLVRSNFILGIASKNLGNYGAACAYLERSLRDSKKFKFRRNEADADNSLGNVYYYQGNFARSLEYFFEALKLYEQLGDESRIAIAYNGIGLVNDDEGNWEEALKNYEKSLAIRIKLNDKYGCATSYNNIGLIFSTHGNYEEALKNHGEALKLRKEINDQEGIADSYVAIGVVYQQQGNLKEAYTNYIQSLSVYENLGNKQRIIMVCINLGELNMLMKKFAESKMYLSRAFELARTIGNKEGIKAAYLMFSKLDSTMGNDRKALEDFKKYVVYRDSLVNEENTKKTVQVEMQYDFDKKTVSDSIRNVEQKKRIDLKHNQEIQQQKLFTYGGMLGFALMLIVAGVSFRAFRNKQKANKIISHQKQLVEEKQKEILDSIHYARRIQKSLLPTEKFIAKNMDRLQHKNQS